MKLTKTERWILSNQYRILEALYPHEAASFAEKREALESGYELEYSQMSQHIYDDEDTLSGTECREVIEILSMFRSLNDAYSNLKDKKGVDKMDIQFVGFDGNSPIEVKYLSYARFFCESGGGRFSELRRGNLFNSHHSTLDIYRRMLDEWEKSSKKYELSKEDVLRISKARIFK
ncbi:MAG: YfbU family protein [Patescibacteria group bacterium]